MSRAALVTLLAMALAMTACTSGGPPPTEPLGPGEEFSYGEDPEQLGELYLPEEGEPTRGTVVIIHGGFWQAQFGRELGRSMAFDLADDGWAVWNLEYRRVGNGGGTPETFEDVAAGIDHLAELSGADGVPELNLDTVVTLGHSAGGHLATWAAARGDHGFSNEVPITHVISQAGVLDLVVARDQGLGGGAVEAFLGDVDPAGPDGEKYDPAQQLPLDAPVWAVHGDGDSIVPPSQSSAYVDAAQDAGTEAFHVSVEGDHFAVIDTNRPAWDRIVEIFDGISPPGT